MKTTQSKQAQTRAQIIRSAVELMSRQGFDGATMKDIARAAGIGDATIYNYFPTKEKLVLGYFDQLINDALADTRQTPGLDGYSLQERLQRLTDAVLERMLPDREFVALARTLAGRSPLLLFGEQLPAKQALRQAMLEFLAAAEVRGEMAPCDFKAALGNLYADYLLGVIAYWLADDSDQFSDTTQLVDLSLGVLVLVLRVGLVDQLLQLGGFVLRSQLARLMKHGNGLLDMLRLARRTLGGEGDVTSAAPMPSRPTPRPASAPPAKADTSTSPKSPKPPKSTRKTKTSPKKDAP